MSAAATPSGHFGPPASASLKLGVIGNCAFSALLDERGRIVWCCLPRFDGDPVFNALLDDSNQGSAFAKLFSRQAVVRAQYRRAAHPTAGPAAGGARQE